MELVAPESTLRRNGYHRARRRKECNPITINFELIIIIIIIIIIIKKENDETMTASAERSAVSPSSRGSSFRVRLRRYSQLQSGQQQHQQSSRQRQQSFSSQITPMNDPSLPGRRVTFRDEVEKSKREAVATTSAKSGEGKGSSSGGRRSPSPVSFLAGASSSLGRALSRTMMTSRDDDEYDAPKQLEEETVVVVVVPL